MEAKVEEGEVNGGGPDPVADRKRLKRLFHDMRGSLNVVIGMSELLVSGAVDPAAPQHQEFLADVLTAGRRLLELVDEFSSSADRGAENGQPK